MKQNKIQTAAQAGRKRLAEKLIKTPGKAIPLTHPALSSRIRNLEEVGLSR